MHSRNNRWRAQRALVCLIAALPFTTLAATRTWTGAGGTAWSDAGNWVGGAPGAGDDAVIANGSDVVLSSSTPVLSSLTISNTTLTFQNWATALNATNVTVQNGATLTAVGDFTEADPSNRVNIVCTDLTLEPGGVIDVDSGGFDGGQGLGNGGSTLSCLTPSGAGYGGVGGQGPERGARGVTYGSASAPLAPGSGGGSHNTATYVAYAGNGGGAVRILASGTVTVDGTITANGGKAVNTYAAGGSGGGVYIVCDTFGGTTNGLIRVNGGDYYNPAYRSGGGGGGRIAVDYVSLSATHGVRFSAAPAALEWAQLDIESRRMHAARRGTLWLPDTALLGTTLDGNQFMDVSIVGITSWSPASLTVSNSSLVFGEDGIVVDVAGDITVDSGGSLGIGTYGEGLLHTLKCGGNLVLTNGGSLNIYSGATNGLGHGALVAVTNELSIGSSSWLVAASHPTNGGSPLIVAGDVTIAAGGGINANAMGYEWVWGPGRSNTRLSADTVSGGAGYGGRGGDAAKSTLGADASDGGSTYGSLQAPDQPGSGGGSHSGYLLSAGPGGGCVRINASGTVTVDGTITADGGDSNGAYGGGGSGGAVHIVCDTFGGAASGLVRVNGASTYNTTQEGGGGGGRIAVDYQNVAATHATRFQTSPASSEFATVEPVNRWAYRARRGTLWVPDTQLLSTTITDQQFTDVRLFGVTSWSPSSLTMSNSWVTFAEDAFTLTVANDIKISGGGLGIGDFSTGSNCVLDCGGSLELSNGAELHVFAGATNGLAVDYGARVGVTGTVTVGSSCWIYPYSHETDGGSAKFVVGGLSVAAGGGINANSRGFGWMNGPGRGLQGTRNGGAGYGGRGGTGQDPAEGGPTYGSAAQPLLPGSSAASHYSYTRSAGFGGGLIRVEAGGTVTVDGTISARGSEAYMAYGGAGSGGGISIQCDIFGGASSGLISAEGGNADAANSAGGGGGGRVAIDYQSLAATHDVAFSVAPGTGGWGALDVENRWQLRQRVGTVWLSDAGMLSGVLTDAQFPGDTSLFLGVPSWSVDSLTVSNCWVAFGGSDFTLTVTNDVVVTGGGSLALGHYSEGSNRTLNCGGSVILTNAGSLHAYGGLTNAMGAGDVSALLAATNDLIVAPGSWIYPASHDTDGGSPVFRMRDLIVATGAGFNAIGKGYRCQYGPGVGYRNSSPGGGGYGGKGGDGNAANHLGGVTYGQTNGPALPGSGGGSHPTSPLYGIRGGSGGGPVRIEARGAVTMDGTVLADGNQASPINNYRAGGSGGGIYVTCDTFGGGAGALMQANGGDAGDAASGGGGGGRVVVWQSVPEADRATYLAGGTVEGLVIGTNFLNYIGGISVTNGTGSTYDPAEPGTAYFIRKAAGNAYTFEVAGDPGEYDTPRPHTYQVHLDVPADSLITNTVDSPADEAAGARHACLGFALTDDVNTPVSNGTGTQIVFQLTTNMVLIWSWTNEYLLTVTASSNGSVNGGVVNGWYTNALPQTNIVATPDGGYIFDQWTGDFPPGHGTDNPLAVTMDQPRTIQALFAAAVRNTKTWAGTGSWTNAANWSPVGVPSSLDDVVVGTGELIVAQPRYMSSLTVSNGATLVFTNWTTKLFVTEDATIQNGGVITLLAAFTEDGVSNRVWIGCSNLTVQAGGVIDVAGRGFLPWNGPGTGGTNAVLFKYGGSYGGRGGRGNRDGAQDVVGGVTYGAPATPVEPGSGGGSHTTDAYREAAGSGGGVVRIEATGAVTVHGTVSADGGPALHAYSAAGSGGGIYVTCKTFGGSAAGVVRARGGDAASVLGGGGGGGGRIAVDYESLAAEHDTRFDLSPAAVDWGLADPDQRYEHAARMGTLWLPDTGLLATTLDGERFTDCNLFIDGVTSWAPSSLTVSNCSLLFAESGFELNVAGDITIGANGALGLGAYPDGSNYVLSCGGSLTLTNGGELHVHGGVTNGSVDYGIRVMVTQDVNIGSSSWIVAYAHATNGGAPRFEMDDLTIASGGGIQASARGLAYRLGPGVGDSASTGCGGGGHGGWGGSGYDPSAGGPTYDSVHAPVLAGSSGGAHYNHTTGTGSGGGVVRIVASGVVTMDGTIAVDGANGPHTYGAGGSGGSATIVCDTFSGNGGLLSASGGAAKSLVSGGAGGGGRLAVDYQTLGSPNTVCFRATPGSVTWAQGDLPSRRQHLPQAGTLSLPDTGLLSGDMTDGRFDHVRLFVNGVTSWGVDSLTVSDSALTFAGDEFSVTVTNTLWVDSAGSLGIGDDSEGSSYSLNCGELILTNGGALHLYGGATNALRSWGNEVSVVGDAVIGPSSWVYPVSHRTNGGSVIFSAHNVSIAEGGGFDADSAGYTSQLGPGGGGALANSPGAGYGGRGGDGNVVSSVGGSTYGSTNAPSQPGSGGGSHYSYFYWIRGGSGGGLVRLNASGTVALDGTLTANGGKATYTTHSAGGSGGGVYVSCDRLESGVNARLAADGGDALKGDGDLAGAGGGGRIAIWQGVSGVERAGYLLGQHVTGLMVTEDFGAYYNGAVSVTNGAGYVTVDSAEPGTAYFHYKPPPQGTIFMVR